MQGDQERGGREARKEGAKEEEVPGAQPKGKRGSKESDKCRVRNGGRIGRCLSAGWIQPWWRSGGGGATQMDKKKKNRTAEGAGGQRSEGEMSRPQK